MFTPNPNLWNTIGRRTLELLFPGSCLACGSQELPLDQIVSFCSTCIAEIVRGDVPVCLRCGARLPEHVPQGDGCAHCREHKLWFDRAITLGEYEDLLRDLLMQMKTDRSERLAQGLAQLIADKLGEVLRQIAPDALVPAPMHLFRRLARGTNPPAALALRLGRELRLPVYPDLLCRRRNIQPQIGLSQPARFRNVRGQVRVRASYTFRAPHVLLVDDILTTGATCSEAARMLKRAGARQVTVLAVARTLLG